MSSSRLNHTVVAGPDQTSWPPWICTGRNCTQKISGEVPPKDAVLTGTSGQTLVGKLPEIGSRNGYAQVHKEPPAWAWTHTAPAMCVSTCEVGSSGARISSLKWAVAGFSVS